MKFQSCLHSQVVGRWPLPCHRRSSKKTAFGWNSYVFRQSDEDQRRRQSSWTSTLQNKTICRETSDSRTFQTVAEEVFTSAERVGPQHSVNPPFIRPTTARAISTDIIRQTIVQHCRTSDLELTTTCSVKLRLSLLSNPDLKLICFLLLSANYSACSASTSVAA